MERIPKVCPIYDRGFDLWSNQNSSSCIDHHSRKEILNTSSINRSPIPVMVTPGRSNRSQYLHRTMNYNNLLRINCLPLQHVSQPIPPSPFTKPKLKIAHLNIQSMKNRNHLIQARHLVKEKDYDVLTIS